MAQVNKELNGKVNYVSYQRTEMYVLRVNFHLLY